ncbi:hypothetical protein PENSPDRAFT_679894 [Peniophora sp. CONT]|nr:hypothetical protein PENSPDRAFT_679894 [Peniophora sp. CONT]
MATTTAQSQRSGKRASSVKGKGVDKQLQKEQAPRQPGWGTTFSGEMAPYSVPRGYIAGFLFRWRLWFECTFAFTMLEPWEKGLLIIIAAIVFTLLAKGIFQYLPMHLVFLYQRAKYYLHGSQTASGFSFGALSH